MASNASIYFFKYGDHDYVQYSSYCTLISSEPYKVASKLPSFDTQYFCQEKPIFRSPSILLAAPAYKHVVLYHQHITTP